MYVAPAGEEKRMPHAASVAAARAHRIRERGEELLMRAQNSRKQVARPVPD
jgi:hypothetical protein